MMNEDKKYASSREIAFYLSWGLISGFIIGFLIFLPDLKNAINLVISNRFFHYEMPRIAVSAFKPFFQNWILLTFFSLIFFSGSYLIQTIFKTFSSKKNKFLYSHPTLIIFCAFFFIIIDSVWLSGKISFFRIASFAGLLFLSIIIIQSVIPKKKRRFEKHLVKISIVVLIFLITLTSASIFFPKMASGKGPNVIFIVVDTLRADHLSCYGYERNTTPNIDKLSQDSLFFENAISQAPWTTPSIASMFTSQFPSLLGIEKNAAGIEDRFLTIAEIFKDNNYLTHGIISHAFLSSVLNFSQGFDAYDEDNVKGENYVSSPSITEKAIEFVNKNKKKRFFLFLHYFDPHFNYVLHDDYDYYPDYEGPVHSGQNIKKLLELAPDMSENDIEYVKALYDSEISFTDYHIGRFLNRLEKLNLYDKSLIVFTSDHGEEFLDRRNGHIGHTKTLYQEMIHVPLMIKIPNSKESKTIGDYVGLIDLMPTMVKYSRLEMPKNYERLGSIINTNEVIKRMILSETKREANLESIILRGWKLLHDRNDNEFKVFDLKQDPLENISESIGKSERFVRMRNQLKRWNRYVKSKRTKKPKKGKDFTQEQRRHLRSLGYID